MYVHVYIYIYVYKGCDRARGGVFVVAGLRPARGGARDTVAHHCWNLLLLSSLFGNHLSFSCLSFIELYLNTHLISRQPRMSHGIAIPADSAAKQDPEIPRV